MSTYLNEESPMDRVTDLIASIEMHRKEIEKETGLEASRNYSLGRLQQALQEEQEAAQADASPVRVATAEALANEIKRVGSLARHSGQRQPQGGSGRPQQQHARNFRQDQQRGKASKSRGRRTMGRSSGR